MNSRSSLMLLLVLCGAEAFSQSTANVAVLKGLATVTVLSQTEQGRAALQANYDVTGAIQTGTTRLPSPLTFEQQQQQALRDASITWNNVAQLADGLGSTLGAAYVARAHDDAHGHSLNVSPGTEKLIAYALSLSGNDSNAGKYLFANLTTNGRHPAPANLQAIMTTMHGEADPFGRAYHLPAGSPNADPFGDSRPFQTLTRTVEISGRDYTNKLSTSVSYQRGPGMDLTESPSYPSGHTTYGFTGALLLGVLVPDRYPEMIVRGAEYGSSRILVGAHYAMDVLGGRATALYDMAHLLANDPAYLDRHPERHPSQHPNRPPDRHSDRHSDRHPNGHSDRHPNGHSDRHTADATSIHDFRAAVAVARRELQTVLASNCGDTVQACAGMDIGRFNDATMNSQAYAATQTYTLPVVFAATAQTTEDVSRLAPEAGYLLTVAYPSLTLKQADDLLTATEGPDGGFLDDGSAFGMYSRLNLYEAAVRARAMEAQHRVAER